MFGHVSTSQLQYFKNSGQLLLIQSKSAHEYIFQSIFQYKIYLYLNRNTHTSKLKKNATSKKLSKLFISLEAIVPLYIYIQI